MASSADASPDLVQGGLGVGAVELRRCGLRSCPTAPAVAWRSGRHNFGVGIFPRAVAVDQATDTTYVTNVFSSTVSVISAAPTPAALQSP